MASAVHTQHLPSLGTYERAVEHYEKRADEHPKMVANGSRLPLGKLTQRDITIDRYSETEIRIRYHRTDIVRFHADGAIVLDPYGSRNTEAIVNEVMGHRLSVVYENQGLGGMAVVLPQLQRRLFGYFACALPGEVRVYRIKDRRVHLVPDAAGRLHFTSEEDTSPIVIPSIDRKVSKTYYARYRLPEFTTYLKAACALSSRHVISASAALQVSRSARLMMVQDRSQWEDLYRLYGASARDQLRQDILREHPECIVWTERPWIEGGEFESVVAARRRYAFGRV